jgi:hypothetical protein
MFAKTPEQLAVLLEELSLQASDAITRLQDPGLPPNLRRYLYRYLDRIEFDREHIRDFTDWLP